MNSCNHNLGFYVESNSSDYAETLFVYMNDTSIQNLELLKKEESAFNFCPDCGESLLGLIDSSIKELKLAKAAREKEEKAKKEKSEKAFLEGVSELSAKVGLDQLPDDNCIVVFHPFLSHNSNDIFLSGVKDVIQKNLFLITRQKPSERDTIKIKAVYKSPSMEEISKFLSSLGFTKKANEKFHIFTKSENETTTFLDYSKDDAKFYITKKVVFEDGEDSSYGQVSVHQMSKFFGKDMTLETIELK